MSNDATHQQAEKDFKEANEQLRQLEMEKEQVEQSFKQNQISIDRFRQYYDQWKMKEKNVLEKLKILEVELYKERDAYRARVQAERNRLANEWLREEWAYKEEEDDGKFFIFDDSDDEDSTKLRF